MKRNVFSISLQAAKYKKRTTPKAKCTNLNQRESQELMCNSQTDKNKDNQEANDTTKITFNRPAPVTAHKLGEESWDSVHNAQDAEEAYNSFHAIVRRALDTACPLSKSRPRGKPKLKFQYDPEVNTLKEDFLKCLYRYELTGSELDKDTMKQKKKTYDLKLRELRRAAAKEHIASSDNKSKALWSIISGEKQKKSLMTHLDN
ncbi:hypothetical protein J6590_088205 [Homalodisca vitripennis]|nr:hypothetical protein J6590_088205 [Homalodisca vitripennis]